MPELENANWCEPRLGRTAKMKTARMHFCIRTARNSRTIQKIYMTTVTLSNAKSKIMHHNQTFSDLD
jgi:hypothetical protein